MNTPSEYGTIAEICAKYNISKSEARRRKQNNTLHGYKMKQRLI